MSATRDPGHKTSAELEREIAEERGRLVRTSDALQERMSVGSLVDDVVERTQAHGGEIFETLGRAMRANPVPLALIGIGVAWMMAGGGRGSAFRDDRSFGTMSAYGGPRARNLRAPGPGPSGIPRHGVDWDRREGEETAPGGRRAAELGSRAASGAGEIAAGARRSGRAAERTLDEWVERQPLVVGALALALGAAVGGVLPNSRTENRMMSQQAERLRRQAAGVASEEAGKARRVANAAADEAARAADEAAAAADARTPGGREVVERAEERARQTAERVAERAEEEAGRQDLGGSLDPDRH